MERKSETERYYKVIFLNEIRNIVNDPDWWYATRAMSAFTLVLSELKNLNIDDDTTEIYTHLHDQEVMDAMLDHPLSQFKMANAEAFCA